MIWLLEAIKVTTERRNEGRKLKLYFLLFEVVKIGEIDFARRIYFGRRIDVNSKTLVGFLVPILLMTRVSTFLFAQMLAYMTGLFF